MASVPVALTIAGSDSGSGAGIQADLKTFAAFQVYGTCALTAVTAQNTLSVLRAQDLEPAMVAAQIDALVADVGVDAVKTGMLSNTLIIEAVADRIQHHQLNRLVVDPVMVAKGGGRLMHAEATTALRRDLLPLALTVTPNAYEAEVLTGKPVRTLADAQDAARAIAALGPRTVVVKGGHWGDDATDVFFDGQSLVQISTPRIATTSTHGTGCTFSAAITAGLAHGLTLVEAVRQAKGFVEQAMRSAFPLGQGHGPLNHFHRWWSGEQDTDYELAIKQERHYEEDDPDRRD